MIKAFAKKLKSQHGDDSTLEKRTPLTAARQKNRYKRDAGIARQKTGF